MRIAMRRSRCSSGRPANPTGSPRCRWCGSAARTSTGAREPRLHGPRRICRQHSESAAGHGIRVPVPADRSGRRDRPDRAHRPGEDTQRAAAFAGRPHAARLPAGLSGPAPGAELHQPPAGLLRRGAGRLERRLGTAGPAGRYDPDACRTLQARAAELRRSDDDALRRHDVADAERNAQRSRSRSRRPATGR